MGDDWIKLPFGVCMDCEQSCHGTGFGLGATHGWKRRICIMVQVQVYERIGVGVEYDIKKSHLSCNLDTV